MTPSATDVCAMLSATVHTVPKLGRGAAENEDSSAVDLATGRFAVADGASTSARPEVWSRLLADAFVHDCVDPLAPDILSRLRGQWQALVRKSALPWYAEAKPQQGADSTFLGLHIDAATGSYQAAGVGDSCLFHLRHSKLIAVGPVDHADAFGRFPNLISSRLEAVPQTVCVLTGTYREGDLFALATDAIAKFLLGVHERHQCVPLAGLIRSRQEFLRGVARYRRLNQLGNDDTTVCVVRT